MRKPHSPTARLRGEHLDDGFCAWRVGGDRQAEEVAIPLDIEIQELATLGLSRDKGPEPGFSLPRKPQHDPFRGPLHLGAEDLQCRPIAELLGRSCSVERARHRNVSSLRFDHTRTVRPQVGLKSRKDFSYAPSASVGPAAHQSGSGQVPAAAVAPAGHHPLSAPLEATVMRVHEARAAIPSTQVREVL